MFITYFRSSSLGSWEFCQQKYFMSYVLGLPEESGKKASMGTSVHKVLECLAVIKKQIQDDDSITFIDDEHIGRIDFIKEDLLKPTFLTCAQVDTINKSRSSKTIYKSPCLLKYNDIRYGEDLVEYIFKKAYAHYSQPGWTHLDKRDCHNWTWMALEYQNGNFDPRKRNIVDAEPHFDFEIPHDWAKYEYTLPNGEEISGNLAIKGTIDLISEVSPGILEIIDWKGLPLETEIPTPQGWTTMGDVDVDDIVFDESGIPTKVIGKSQVKNKDCYEIIFDDTSVAISDDEHLWKLDDGKIVTTKQLKEKQKINVTKPLITKDIELPIDPYVLGAWLGDGRNRNGEITSSNNFIFQEIRIRGYKVGKDIASKNRSPQKTVYGLRTLLRKNNLLNNKHIPHIYLRASINQRLDLLRGLMDTDGNINHCRKQAIFTNCNKRLSDDTKELLLSLGQRPLQSDISKPHNYKDKKRGNICKIYPISFRPIDINPFLMPIKAEKIDNNKWGNGCSNKRTITSIKYIGKKKTQCIKVDSVTSTYLCTRNMIPTHNTGQRLDWATGERKDQKKLEVDPQLNLYYYAANLLYPGKQIIPSIFYIRDGGPFSICLDDSSLEWTEKLLKTKFNEIKKNEFPKMLDPRQKNFKCNRLCHYYKNNFPGDNENMCKRVNLELKENGIDHVIKTYSNPDHSIHKYSAPGE